MRILGIDPGLRVTGYALLTVDATQPRLAEGGTLSTAAREPLAARLATLMRDMETVVRENQPDCVAVEAVHSRAPFPQSAILLSHARGVLLAVAAAQGLEVWEYTAADIKKSVTGHGAASKEQVARMIEHRLGVKQPIAPDHVTDAAAAAFCHWASLRAAEHEVAPSLYAATAPGDVSTGRHHALGSSR